MARHGLVLIAISILAAGCAAGGSLSREMADWQGRHVSAALEAWGEPDGREALGDQTVLTWFDQVIAPAGFSGEVAAASAIVCERKLAVAGDGTVTGWRWRGDRCEDLSPAKRQRLFSAARQVRD